MTNQEIIAVIQAYEDGKVVQYEAYTGEWYSVKTPEWNFQKWSYRVKPEPEPPRYEPFGFEDDLVGKVVIYNERKHLIVLQDQTRIFITGIGWISYDNHVFLNLIKNQDGTPFGKLKNE